MKENQYSMEENVQYSDPVKKLITCGDPRGASKWPSYLQFGLSSAHVPELMRMLSDEQFTNALSSCAEVWAPLHAWRALGQLQAVEAIPTLLDQLVRIDEDDDDWVGEELPEVFAMIGPAAIPALTRYLAASDHGLFARVCAASSLSHIGLHSSEVRLQCIDALVGQLTCSTQNDPTLNGFLVSDLVELQAVEALSSIQRVYQQNCVDPSIVGDCEEVEMKLGVRTSRETPRNQRQWALDGMRHHDNRQTVLPPPRPITEQAITQQAKKKIGRNAPCPCGSGKKYKKCCLNNT
jgi:hypothetical protein